MLTALFWLELVARIMRRDGGLNDPVLVSLTAAEPMTEFEKRIYDALDSKEG